MNFDFALFWHKYGPKWEAQTCTKLLWIALFSLVVLLILAYIFHWSVKRTVAVFLLVTYLVIVFASTVFTRKTYSSHHAYTELFWSYKWGLDKYGHTMMREIIMNTLLLFPVGFLFPVIMGKPCARLTVFLGFLCTCSIEVLQYFLMKGLFEFDDIIHNTLGVIIGYMLWRCVYQISHREKRKKDGIT